MERPKRYGFAMLLYEDRVDDKPSADEKPLMAPQPRTRLAGTTETSLTLSPGEHQADEHKAGDSPVGNNPVSKALPSDRVGTTPAKPLLVSEHRFPMMHCDLPHKGSSAEGPLQTGDNGATSAPNASATNAASPVVRVSREEFIRLLTSHACLERVERPNGWYGLFDERTNRTYEIDEKELMPPIALLRQSNLPSN